MKVKLLLVQVESEGLPNGCSSSSRLFDVSNSFWFSIFKSKNLGNNKNQKRNDKCTPESSNDACELSSNGMWIDISISNCGWCDDDKPDGWSEVMEIVCSYLTIILIWQLEDPKNLCKNQNRYREQNNGHSWWVFNKLNLNGEKPAWNEVIDGLAYLFWVNVSELMISLEMSDDTMETEEHHDDQKVS